MSDEQQPQTLFGRPIVYVDRLPGHVDELRLVPMTQEIAAEIVRAISEDRRKAHEVLCQGEDESL